MADTERDGRTDDRTSGTNQEQGDMIDASRATQGASPSPSDGSDTRGQQGDGVQDSPEVTGDEGGGAPDGKAASGDVKGSERETGRVGQGEMSDRGGVGGYGGSSGYEGGAQGARDK